MTNDQLRAFVAVAEQGSFRAAATSLHKTQPSISNAIKTLESQFDFSLFDRNNYRPVLSTEGKAFYNQAKKLLTQATELEMFGHHLARADMTQLSISLSAMCAFPPVLNKIKDFCTERPQMRLQLNTEHLSGVLEQIQLDKSEFAIGPLLGVDQKYEFIEVGEIKMVTVIAPQAMATLMADAANSGSNVNDNSDSEEKHPILSHQQLRQLPHILITDTGSVARFDHVNIISGSRPWYVNDYQMKKALLVSAMGWARIPEHIVKTQLKAGSLIKIQVENFNFESTVPMYLIKLKQQPLSVLAKAFWQHMISDEESVN
jgi:DNA-binding transcriptional LysR family regulator